MYSLRRAALRHLAIATRAVAVNMQTTSFAARFGQSARVVNAPVLSAIRSFSQTYRASNSEDTAPERSSAKASADSRPGETPYALFVRNMVFDANEQHLTEAFEKYGPVTKTSIARDARGLSRGYGFVWFENAEDMTRAAAEVNGSFWHGRRIQVQPRTASRTEDSSPREPTTSLYVGNIPYETTDAELNRIFRELENVTDVRVAVDRTTGWPRGFAHADFKDIESAEAGYNKLKGMTLAGRELRLDFASGSSRAPRRSRSDTPPDS